MLKCYPVQFQNNLTVSLIVLHCARMSGAAFLLPFEIFFVISTSRGIMVGRGEGSGGAFYPFDFKTTETEPFQALMLCICSAFFFDQWCVLSEMNLSSIVSCLISYVVHCIRPLWRILQSSLVLIMLEFQEVRIYVKNLGIQLCSILPCVSSVLVTKRSKCDHKQEHETSCMQLYR